MPTADPRLSILIPNFNNGLESSRDGQTDLIGQLMQSLYDSLCDDPTPLEIIAYDDGSTDDSLATLRDWTTKCWPDGRPVLELIEAQHCGVLSKTANILVRRSRGAILVRLDGDVLMLTANWAEKLCKIFDQGPQRLGVVGPKQLMPSGKIHSFGDWILHPKGYHHVAMGLDRDAVTRPMEVDHVMGCFYCCKRAVYDDVGGYDETILRGQTIDFGLQARLKGWSCIAVPHIEFVHRHTQRVNRATKADQEDGVAQTRATFQKKWGFDRIAPDLDVVRQRYRGTNLLWNAAVFAAPNVHDAPNNTANTAALTIQNSTWGRYTNDDDYKQHINFRVSLTMHVIKLVGKVQNIAVVGNAAGPLTHLLATQGLTTTGVDSDLAQVEFSRDCVKNQSYPGQPPRFIHQSDDHRLPLDDGAYDLVLLYDQLERHDNPVALLGEARRVLDDDKTLVIVSARPVARLPSPAEAEHLYLWPELLGQVTAVGGWRILSDPRKDNAAQPLVLIARRSPLPVVEEQTPPADPRTDSQASACAA